MSTVEDENITTKFLECGFYKGKGIAVLTSGGDSQGMNATVRAVVRMGLYLGCEVYFIKEGYQGMVEGGDHIVQAKWSSVSSIIHKGGTEIGSARCKEFLHIAGRLEGAKNLIKRKINNLVVIGGDGSLTGANIFKEEWHSHVAKLKETGEITEEEAEKFKTLQIIGLVGSIDNDFCGTDMTIGTNSALHRIIEAIDAINSTAYSHQRTFILEIMGRHCGYLALIAAMASEADFVFLPEQPPEDNWEQTLCVKLAKKRESGQRLNIVIVSEGAIDRSGEPIKVEKVKEVIVKTIQQDAKVSVLGHMQRGGNASAFDRVLGCRMGAEAVVALMEAKPDEDAVVIALEGNHIVRLPLMTCVEMTQDVTKAMKIKDWNKASELRGLTFMRNLKVYKMLSEAIPAIPLSNARYVYGVVFVGAPASGMNAAVHSFVRSSLCKGDVVYGIQDSIEGLCLGLFQTMQWSDVNGWVGMGGANLGTKRTLPEGRFDLIAEKLKQYNIQALLILGGFEAFQAALQLTNMRKQYPEFRIPILILPATISNNVPGTEFSLGCDTALNEIVEICDRVRQSAQGTKRRAFVIETMGGYCGYLATLAGLAAGADAAYIFEEKFSIKDLEKDVHHLAAKMSDGVQRGLILRNEKCNENYNADFMHRLFAEEGKGLFSARMNILGHMQQGGSPSPFDRGMGIKFGVEASNWFEKILGENNITNFEQTPNLTDDGSACLLGVVKRHYLFQPLQELVEGTNFQYRIPKKEWWLKLRPLMRILAKHYSVYGEEGEYIQVDPRIRDNLK